MIYYISRAILWLLFKICFRYRVIFAEDLPGRGSFIIASNHLSFLDPPAAGFITARQVCFLARDDLFKNILFGLWARAVGVIPVKRGRFDLSAMKGSLEKLQRGYVVALFPEGTRSGDGTIHDPKGGVGFLAAKAGVPVIPVLVKGSDGALPRHAIMIRFKPVEVRVGKAVRPDMFRDKDSGYDYQALSKEVMKRIMELDED
ncbi:MAG: 1-acyl-sn-glycerol-3-phosphate acyltransferase [Candidatus Omnitrophica bacterium]|nr:1-acyl-sn-glycerol-3-phosphate acyltransferase [Candidatus Omnitrophota bacterium]